MLPSIASAIKKWLSPFKLVCEFPENNSGCMANSIDYERAIRSGFRLFLSGSLPEY